MPDGLFQELDGAEARLFAAADVEALVKVYAAAQGRIRRILADQPTDFERWRYEQILAQIGAELTQLSMEARKWASGTIPNAYRRGSVVAAHTMAGYGAAVRDVDMGSRLNARAIKVLVDQSTADLLQTNVNMKVQLDRYIRATQQQVIKDAAISDAIAEGLAEGVGRRSISGRIERQLREAMGQEQYVWINGRHYRPDYYAAMVARTRTREATGQGTIMTCLEYGNDLVQTDVHSNACPICQTHMGRVYSISGTHPDFPPLADKAPFHPHCLCSMIPVVEQIMRMRGTYEAMAKLSSRTPTFQSEKAAQGWLDQNPHMQINSIYDLQDFVRRN